MLTITMTSNCDNKIKVASATITDDQAKVNLKYFGYPISRFRMFLVEEDKAILDNESLELIPNDTLQIIKKYEKYGLDGSENEETITINIYYKPRKRF